MMELNALKHSWFHVNKIEEVEREPERWNASDHLEIFARFGTSCSRFVGWSQCCVLRGERGWLLAYYHLTKNLLKHILIGAIIFWVFSFLDPQQVSNVYSLFIKEWHIEFCSPLHLIFWNSHEITWVSQIVVSYIRTSAKGKSSALNTFPIAQKSNFNLDALIRISFQKCKAFLKVLI